MKEIKKILETWKTEKGSFIPNASIYGMFIKELEDAIEKQEQINKLTIPVVTQLLPKRLSSNAYTVAKGNSYDGFVNWWDAQV